MNDDSVLAACVVMATTKSGSRDIRERTMDGGWTMESSEDAQQIAPVSLAEGARLSGWDYKSLRLRVNRGLLKPIAFTPSGKPRFNVAEICALPKLPSGRPSNIELWDKISILEERILELEAHIKSDHSHKPDSDQ